MSIKSNLKTQVLKEIQRLAEERLGYSTPGTWEASKKYLETEYQRVYGEWYNSDAEKHTVLELQNALVVLKLMSWNKMKEEE